jgi:tripartite-type tricarboxylate transporter receptor subunit TctC
MGTPEAEKYFMANAWKPIPMTPAELAVFQRTDIARWQRMVKTAGIEPE